MRKFINQIEHFFYQYWFIVLIWLFWLAIYFFRSFLVPFIWMNVDTRAYDNFQIENLFHQERAPLYGILLDLLDFLFGDMRFTIMVILQIAVSFVALVYLYKAFRMVGIRRCLSIAIIFAYGLSLSSSTWNICVLTESFSISGFIFVLYNIFCFVRYGKLYNGIAATCITFFLVFLRPQFLLHYAVLGCYFVLRAFLEQKSRIVSCKIIGVFSIGIVFILIYCSLFYNVHGIFSISTAKGRQQLYVCIDQNLYKNYPDKEIVNAIDNELNRLTEKDFVRNDFDDQVDELHELFSSVSPTNTNSIVSETVKYCVKKYGNAEVDRIASWCISNNLSEYLKYLFRTVVVWSTVSFEGGGCPETPFDNLKVGHVILISFLQGCVMMFLWIKNRRPPWIHMGLFAFTFPVLWSTFILTNNEFTRTMIYVVPPTYISIALFAEWFLSHYPKLKQKYPRLDL